jgi:hypothetical protein
LCKYGPPDKFLSDNGREFVNAGFAFICKRWGIEHTCTGGYQPQALPTERWHRWLNHMMTALSAKFGLAWNTYLQAVVFNYNVSVCASTGYSPFELMFGRTASYLQDLAFTRTTSRKSTSQRTANSVDWGCDLVAYSSAIYKIVRENQAKIASANQARNNKNRSTINFTPEDKENNINGDLILFWEPRQTKRLRDDTASVLDASKAPKKWTPIWTGPHTVVAREGDNHYRIFHRGKGTRIKTHVNRLVRFYPWSDVTSSTSDWEDTHAYRSGEWAHNDVMIVVPLLQPHPFGVAMLTNAKQDGSIEYQWWGNNAKKASTAFSITQTYSPGWIRNSTSSRPTVYYGKEKENDNDIPYMGHEETPMTQRDIVVHSFELTASERLPAVILKATDEDYRVWWTMRPEEIAKAATTSQNPDSLNAIKGHSTSARNNTRHENHGRMNLNKGETNARNNTRHEAPVNKSEGPDKKRRKTAIDISHRPRHNLRSGHKNSIVDIEQGNASRGYRGR